MITETQKINRIIELSAKTGMTIEQIIKLELDEWLFSKIRGQMIVGERYYRNKADIESKTRENPKRKNNKLRHGFIRKLVNQKTDYLLAKPFNIKCNNTKYSDLLLEVFNNTFRMQLQKIGKQAINKGIGWMQVYFDENGIAFKVLPSEEIIPLWKDDIKTILDGVIRTYIVTEYEGKQKKDVRYVEYWTTNGIKHYKYVDDALTINYDNTVNVHFYINDEAYNWDKLPFIPFRYNDDELPLIEGLKELADDYNYQKSITADVLADIQNLIYVLKGYSSDSLKEFLEGLYEYNAISVDEGGAVDTLSADIDITAFDTYQKLARRDIFEFGRGVDTQADDLGNASGVALKYRYADLDMDCNGFENEFQSSLQQLLWFINQYFIFVNKGDYTSENVEFIFNRDIIVNESETIENCSNSKDVISDKTIINNHPWVNDVNEEIKQLNKEQAQKLKAQQESFNIEPDVVGGNGA